MTYNIFIQDNHGAIQPQEISNQTPNLCVCNIVLCPCLFVEKIEFMAIISCYSKFMIHTFKEQHH